MDDDELIAAMAGGDDTALGELFARHAPWLAARLRPILPAAEVEDVLQESFLAVWRGAGGYRPEGSAGGWLWGSIPRQGALMARPPGGGRPWGGPPAAGGPCRWPWWPARPTAGVIRRRRRCPGPNSPRRSGRSA